MTARRKSTGEKVFEAGVDAQRAFRRALGDVGRNLPREPVGVEGSNVDRITRHGNKARSEDESIQDALAHPHADAEQETVDEFDL